MLSDKEMRLLRVLLDANEPVTARALAAQLGVSLRTVKTYVAQINAEKTGCITSGRDGYRVHAEAARALMGREQPGDVPQTSGERVPFLLQKLLASKEPVNVFDLCEELFISLSTLKTDLGRVRRKLASFKLRLIQENNTLRLEGLEKDMRKLAGDLLYSEASVNFLDLRTIQHAFPDIDTAFISDCMRDTLDEFHHFANDYSIINLVLHVAITIDRIRSKHELPCGGADASERENTAATLDTGAPDGVTASLRSRDYELARAIIAKMEPHFHVAFSPVEVYELALLIASRTTMLDYRTATRDNIERFVGADCLALVQEIIADLSGYYGIDLSEPEFFVRFALHIKNLLLRAKSGGLSKNPLTQQIQANCPLLYDTAVAEASLIRQRTGFDINDDEIAYIAFHLGSTLETQKQLTNKVKAVLYCPSYYDIDAKVTLFLERHFEVDLLATNVVTEECDLQHLTGVELLIATVPVNAYIGAPTYRINIFPNEQDRTNLQRIIDSIKREKRRAALRSNLEELIKPELFEVNDVLRERDEVIHAMAERLVELGNVGPDFEGQVRERERLSSTAFATFAMPHAVRLCSERSSISVMVSHVPIAWDTANVRLVIMLSFNRRDRAVFYEIFDPLVSILSDPQQVASLVKTTDYTAFIAKLCELME